MGDQRDDKGLGDNERRPFSPTIKPHLVQRRGDRGESGGNENGKEKKNIPTTCPWAPGPEAEGPDCRRRDDSSSAIQAFPDGVLLMTNGDDVLGIKWAWQLPD